MIDDVFSATDPAERLRRHRRYRSELIVCMIRANAGRLPEGWGAEIETRGDPDLIADTEGMVALLERSLLLGSELMLLHHVGVKSGVERVSPLSYRRHGAGFVIFGSKGGAPRPPDWYVNLMARPRTWIEVEGKHLPVTARRATGEERAEIWARQVEQFPYFTEFEMRAGREIPVIVLDPHPEEE